MNEDHIAQLESEIRYLKGLLDENGIPQDWQSSFGMKVAEHDMSTQVNFLDGYISPSDTEQTEGSDE